MRHWWLGIGIMTAAVGSGAQEAVPAAPALFQRAADGHPDLSGQWAFDPERSDRPGDRLREKKGGRPGAPGGPGGGRGGPGAGGRAGGPPPGGGPGGPGGPEAGPRPPAERLLIEQHGEEIVIDDDSGLVRRLHSDGRKAKTDNGLTEVRTRWEGDTLVSEMKRGRGTKQRVSYALSPDGSQLLVTTRFEPPAGEPFDVQLVYLREVTR